MLYLICPANRDITYKLPKYFSGLIVALNHECVTFRLTLFFIFADLNQDFGCNSWSGATNCPEKFSVALSVMSLIDAGQTTDHGMSGWKDFDAVLPYIFDVLLIE